MTHPFTIMVCLASWFEMPSTKQLNIAYFYNLTIEAEDSITAIEAARSPVEEIIQHGTLIDAYCPTDQARPIEEIIREGKHLYTRISFVDYVDSEGNHYHDPKPNLMPRTELPS